MTDLAVVEDGDGLAVVEDDDEVATHEDRPLPYVGRAAICFMAVDAQGDDAALYERLKNSLKDDPRVESVEAVPPSRQTFMRLVLNSFGSFEDDESVGDDTAPDPFSHLHAFSFRRPMLLQVRSPRRLQRPFNSFKRIPADRYWAAWDGLTLVVLWELEDLAGRTSDGITVGDLHEALSPAGGLLVQDILKDASEKCESEFRTVACSPNCNYTFAHSNLVIETVGETKETVFHAKKDGLVRVDLGAKHEPDSAVEELHNSIGFAGRAFARMRSDGRTMEAAAWSAHIDVSKLLQLNYERAALSAKSFLKSLRERWMSRKWRREARQLVARICLDLATLEHVRSDWTRIKHIYDDSSTDENVAVVFASEYKYGLDAVSTLEVGEARSAIERVTTSLDTRALVLATAIGAIIGALVGALVGTLI